MNQTACVTFTDGCDLNLLRNPEFIHATDHRCHLWMLHVLVLTKLVRENKWDIQKNSVTFRIISHPISQLYQGLVPCGFSKHCNHICFNTIRYTQFINHGNYCDTFNAVDHCYTFQNCLLWNDVWLQLKSWDQRTCESTKFTTWLWFLTENSLSPKQLWTFHSLRLKKKLTVSVERS